MERLTTDAVDPRERMEVVRLVRAVPRGETPTAAAAEALAYVTDLAEGVGASLLSARPEADSTFRDGIAQIGVHIAITADSRGLRSLLSQLESGPTPFRVLSVAVTQPAPAAEPPEVESLRVEISLESIGRFGKEGTQ